MTEIKEFGNPEGSFIPIEEHNEIHGFGKVRRGPKKGSQNALKSPEDRRSIKKMVTFKPNEWAWVEQEVIASGLDFNNYARSLFLKTFLAAPK